MADLLSLLALAGPTREGDSNPMASLVMMGLIFAVFYFVLILPMRRKQRKLETLVKQLEETKQEHYLELPYHKMIMNDEIPLSIGGGIGQARTYMYLLRTAHLGEVTVTVWPKELKEICEAKNIHVLE